MTYTEIKEKNRRRYYYRVSSIRRGDKISKRRKYLGVNLSKADLTVKECEADKGLGFKKRDALGKIKQKIIKILKQNKIKRAGIFGSYARGETNKNSDIDIIIKPTKDMGFKFAGLEIQLTRALKKKADLVSYNGLSPHLRDKILSQEIRII